MLHVTDDALPTILARDEGPAAELVNPHGTAPVCLVCEHASAAIPAALGDLGLADADRLSHAVWDIGAAALARALSDALDAPLVMARVSRLVHDCNRPPTAPDAIPAQAERIAVPGNGHLGAADRAARVAQVYDPFHRLLADTLDGFATPPALVTIHSFAPIWYGAPRAVELGLLHDTDDRLATRMAAGDAGGLRAALNEPYSMADGVTHTLARHALPRGLDNVMIEVRNDLLASGPQIARICHRLEQMLRAALPARKDAAE